jgi:membrane protease YdiL (CAAX protease family)
MSEAERPDNPRAVVRLAIAVEGGLIGVALLAGWLFRTPPLEHFFWDGVDALWGLAATGPMLVLFFVCLRWPVGPLKPIQRFCDDVVRPLLSPCSLLDLAGIATLAGLGEEMLFRGVLQTGLAERIGDPWLGLALASVLFGLCHAITAAYLVLATLLGAYLGALFLRTDNLMPAVLAHALYDFVALVVLLRFRAPLPPSIPQEPSDAAP